MRLAIDLGAAGPPDGWVVSLLRGVFGALFAERPELEAALFCPPHLAHLFPPPTPAVERVVLPAARYHARLDREAARRRPHVLFRAGPSEHPLSVPLARQVVFVPEVRHEYYWEFFRPEEVGRRTASLRPVLAGAGAVAVPSEHGRCVLRALAAPRDLNVFLLPPALEADPAAGDPLTLAERACIPEADFFLYPADLLPHKNHDRLLEAFTRFLRSAAGTFELVLVGDPAGWPELKARHPGLPVRHVGRVRPTLLRELYRRARALVYFSLYEGFGAPLLEAFRAGTPAACANVSSLPEVAGDAAILGDPADVAAMAEALTRVASDEGLRRRLTAAGAARLACYRWSDGAHSLWEACRRVAGANPAVTPALRLRRSAVRRISAGLGRCRRCVNEWIGPKHRFAVVDQYPPRPLKLPEHYHRTLAPDPAPVVCVVTPSYNQAAYLEQTLRSVLDQGYPRLQYVVQDGGSTDGSAALLERYGPRLTHWESRPDRGQAHAINQGFQRAAGEIMAFLNSDDLLLPGALAFVAHHFANHPETDVVYGHRVVIDGDGREVGRLVLPPHNDAVLRWDDTVPQETMFWRRRIWERAGGRMDESFHFALDWDLILRFLEVGARFVRLPRFLGAFRAHRSQKSVTHVNDFYHPEVRRLRERSHGRPVAHQEICREREPFLRKQAGYQRLYTLGLIRC